MGLSVEAVLAIDAGNSKTDVAVVAADGRLLGTSRGGAFHPHRVGAEAAVDGLAPLVSEAVERSGPVELRHLSACLANVDLPFEHDALESALAGRAWAATSEVVNDTFALLRAGLDSWRGIAVICGAGINCTGVLPDGRTARFAAVGTISGDWGGGAFLWQEAMWWAARAEDGRGPDTLLRTALPQHLGLPSMAELIEAIHAGRVPEERCAELTPLLFTVAEAGDPVAADVVRHQAREVVALAVAAARRLGVDEEPIDVVLGGGVLTAGHQLLMEEIDRGLAAVAPKAQTRVVTIPPVAGAALLGLDRIGAGTGAHQRLRDAYTGMSS
ncbi:N-acetylglucosamine kinase [Nocardioides sp. URHA0032]|uniref:N-acetylglucosamine kinase n=1 Tax=Nocardioides sp. URHA0032 TaxID=1380388 RepID=UPI00048F380A|nr:BadF/BadG/BcrA/BcrD ATPase family protein [Nocardioides sp. URHA0032]